MDSVEIFFIAIVVLLGTILSSYRAYIAWFEPERHREFLEVWGRFFEGWPLGAYAFWVSSFNFWLMRLAFTFGLLLFIIASVLVIWVNLES